MLADEGSGWWIGQRALMAVMRQFDGRGPATSLTPRVLAHFGVSEPFQLVYEVYYRDTRRRLIASLSEVVRASADEGDPVARELITAAAVELVVGVRSVAERLEMRGAQFPLVLAGSIFRVLPALREEVIERVAEVAPRSQPRLLEAEPALGAVRLALAEARGGARLPVYI
jgi:N-acetylglucosamine kinase-like BadF-type ATPase